MSTFVNAVKNQSARTANGMKAKLSSGSANVDLFYKIGASRGKNIVPSFISAYVENKDYALRIAQWARDVREGSGERQLYRDILMYLDKNDPEAAIDLLYKTPELGRWDDVLIPFTNKDVQAYAHMMIREALKNNDGLCAKWMPRKGETALRLRKYLNWSPKYYRKRLVELTKVVETQMCANQWDDINFSHVPSLASARYKKAFGRHTTKYSEYIQKLVKGDKTVKINASAVYPYDVLKGLVTTIAGNYYNPRQYSRDEIQLIEQQWKALPNYVGDSNVLPIVDVSGSMGVRVGAGKIATDLTCLDVAISLGLYVSDKNKGKFKDTFMTFSASPQLFTISGTIDQKIQQLSSAQWQMNTDLHAAFKRLLQVAIEGNVPQEEMPSSLLIISDMQFDSCARYDDSAIEMIRRKYTEAGYDMPNIIFWNVNSYDNTPVSVNEKGTALISGFSPSIVKTVLSGSFDEFTPEAIMLKAIMKPRYDI